MQMIHGHVTYSMLYFKIVDNKPMLTKEIRYMKLSKTDLLDWDLKDEQVRPKDSVFVVHEVNR